MIRLYRLEIWIWNNISEDYEIISEDYENISEGYRIISEGYKSYEDDATVRWVIHHEVWLWSSVGIITPVAEEVVAHTLLVDGLEETGWDDLVCIYILQRKRNAA